MTSPQTIGELGERELIRCLSPWVLSGGSLNGFLGVGDDCAVVDPPASSRLVLTTDMLVDQNHFLWNTDTDWTAVGHKAAAANLSDLAAMGAQPSSLLVSIAAPPAFKVDDILNLYRGIHDLCKKFDTHIIGGDTTRSDRLCISITAVGWQKTNHADCLRGDARPGDHLYVTGDLGSSRAGLELILKLDEFKSIPDETAARLVRRHFTPTPRIAVGIVLSEILSRVAIVDISDSLYNEACLMAEASNNEIQIDVGKIPISKDTHIFCRESGKDDQQFSLFSGEEYELLFAAPDNPEALREKLKTTGIDCAVTHIGTVNLGNGVKLFRDGKSVKPDNETFAHFS